MFTTERTALLGDMQRVLLDYLETVASWIDGESGAIEDRWDTIYSENYTAGTAAVLFANGYAFSGDAEHRNAALTLIRRSAERLRDDTAAPFTRMFIYHYGMMALLMLPAEARAAAAPEFREAFLGGEPQDCGTINLNCAALQLGNELFLEELDYRPADEALMRKLMALMEERQHDGFLNDALDSGDQVSFKEQDGMPIAYSAFILFILTGILSVVRTWTAERAELRMRLEAVIERGQTWFAHATSFDGTYAMMERSRHQKFTWGSFVAFQAYAGMGDEGLFARAFESWLPYRKEDGSYSITPNHLPHELRTGYEWYTLVGCYGILGMTGISVAERIVRLGLGMERINDRAALPRSSRYADPRSGYAFVREGDDFFACCLRMHEGRYSPALCGFHFRINGRKPPLAEPRLNPDVPADRPYRQGYDLGAWEGYLLRGSGGELLYPDMTDNPELRWLERGVELTADSGQAHCVKSIRLIENGIEWSYKLTPGRGFVSCEHILPLLLTDGRSDTRIQSRTARGWTLLHDGRTYELTCSAGDNRIATPDAVYDSRSNLSLSRSLLSVSGISASLSLTVSRDVKAGERLSWTTTLVEVK